jgi:hypothetical protein
VHGADSARVTIVGGGTGLTRAAGLMGVDTAVAAAKPTPAGICTAEAGD